MKGKKKMRREKGALTRARPVFSNFCILSRCIFRGFPTAEARSRKYSILNEPRRDREERKENFPRSVSAKIHRFIGFGRFSRRV